MAEQGTPRCPREREDISREEMIDLLSRWYTCTGSNKYLVLGSSLRDENKDLDEVIEEMAAKLDLSSRLELGRWQVD